MRISTTIVLGILAIVLGVVIEVVNEAPEVGRSAAADANVLIRFEPGAVRGLTIERGPARVEIGVREGQWFFVEPEQDRVDARAVAALLDDLNHLAILDEISESEGLEPVSLGVEGDEAIRITLRGEDEDGEAFEESVVVGSSAPRTNSIYARRGEDDTIRVVDGNPRALLESPLQTLRDPRLLSVPAEAIVGLGIRRPTGEMQLGRRITPPLQDWALQAPLQAWAGVEEMDELLADLGSLTIAEVRKDEDLSAKIPDPLPEGSAVIQFQVFGIEKPITLFLSEHEAPPVEGAPALVEARISDRPYVYRVRSRILEMLPAEANDLRSRTLARIPGPYLNSISIESPIDPWVYLRSERTETGLRWDVRMNNRLLPANQSEVGSMVSGLNEARILDFASDSAEDLARFGFDRPERRITFELRFPSPPAEDGTPQPDQEMTRVLRLGWGKGDTQRLFAYFEGEPYVYEVDPTLLSLVPSHPVKWKSLSVLGFSNFALRSITREVPGREALKLTYRYTVDQWDATRNGVDVSEALDPVAARRLADRLGDLRAAGWYLSLGAAYEALQNPSAEFMIVTSELDRAVGEPVETTTSLRFAPSSIVIPPSSEPLYFGQVEGSPDVFFIEHEVYRNLIRPVTTARAP